MNENDRILAVNTYLNELTVQLRSGHAREHAYRPALERLMASFEDVIAVNDPRRSENGNPDFVFLRKSNVDMILGYAEAKDITVDLDKTLKSEQLRRYAGYEKLFLTNYRDFIFLANGEEYLRISIGSLNNGIFTPNQEQALRLAHELYAFLSRRPEAIKSGKRLAVIMGGKARRIRDNVTEYLTNTDNVRNIELDKIYGLMKSLLVHDLSKEQFSDLYAQTLVYGLFAARYNDETPDSFDRREAVENVPKTNPFLRQFFNHIAGADFDARLRYIVDELCEVFSISDIRALVRHQATKFAVDDERDLTIHFYEDFLKEYDPVMRQKMGVYYTPLPVVKFIVRSVDQILKNDFGIEEGLASTQTISHTVDTQPWRKKGERKDRLTKEIIVPRVQVLDPAVGTATFLNETIKHVYKEFVGQEGRWPSYVKTNLIKRIHGFELMMAPYTIAHLKLSMTLRETGVTDITDRLGVYLTNTLEEGVPSQQDLLSLLGLAGAVSEESQHAADIKTSQPVMVVMGNPPYSVSSNNKSAFIQNLIKDYKKDLNERKINLDDDYIKFIRFAEHMVAKNGEGIVAMITNNSYIDGITHRQMRKHLLETFDKIYVLDLHGSTMKQEKAPDGGEDKNVFDIMQGVSIILAAKKHYESEKTELAKVFHADVYGPRKHKFDVLNSDQITYSELFVQSPNYFFTPKDFSEQDTYGGFVALEELMPNYNSGIQTKRDKLVYNFHKSDAENVVSDFSNLELGELVSKYNLADDGRDWTLELATKDVKTSLGEFSEILYHPLDKRETWYSGKTKGFMAYPRSPLMRNMLHDNVAIITIRNSRRGNPTCHFISDTLIDKDAISPFDNSRFFPLWLYHDDGERTINFDSEKLDKLTQNLSVNPSPEAVIDYIYAVLHSRNYREKYKEFLRIDFPRIPVPTQDDFNRLVPLGQRLRELHLMKGSFARSTTFPEVGDCLVDTPRFIDNKVFINDSQYFGNVPEDAWNSFIGGYQPAQKWLKDRKGRTLDDNEITHYQNLIQILIETEEVMDEIDKI